MRKGKTDLDFRPNTSNENKRVLCELRNRTKIDRKSLHETNKLITKFNEKNALRISKNAKASLDSKQEKIQMENLYGSVDRFPAGSWWGIRMDCARDGVHEPFNKDIQEGPFGAVSLCTSHLNMYNDVDLGDYLTLTANEYKYEKQIEHPLLQNYQNQLPLRLVRSYNLTNDYAPKTGYRYDGLYTVAACWIGVNSETEKYYKFALVRLPFQDPPTWKLSRKSSSQMNNCKVRSTGKLTNDHSSDSQNNVNDEESMKNIRRRSLMTKCSLQKPNISKRESTIVERCISKKSDGQSFGGMVSVPYTETIASNNRRLDNNSSSSPVGKFQSTNISIRTELYDSSNIINQDTKKTIPMTFCRTYKNSRSPALPINLSNVVSLNLSSCGPCPKDNAQESLIQSRSGIPKFSNDRPPCSDHVVDRSTPKVSTIEFKSNFHDNRITSPKMGERKVDRIIESSNETTENNGLGEEQIDKENLTETIPDVQITNDFGYEDRENVQISVPNGTESLENLDDPLTLRDELAKEQVSKENYTDLDSLTPDQMLNFIVKQKYHPRAKLLIGSVIGLATGESTILRAYESLMSRKNCCSEETNVRLEKKEKEKLQRTGGKLAIVDSRNYKSENKNSTNVERSKDIKTSKSLPSNRVLRENKDRLMKKMTLRRTRMSKRLVGTEKKSNSKNLRANTSKRLIKTNRSDVKSQQPFSKSTILKKSQKRVKKRRGELANLVIDANIGPLIRGPRNRRLRCKTHTFAKNIHKNGDVPSCCAKKVADVARGGKKELRRVEMSMRKTKVPRIKAQMAESRFGGASKRVMLRETDENCSVRVRNNFPDKLLVKSVKIREKKSTEDRSTRGEKRKLPRARSLSRDATESNGFIKTICRNLRDKNVETAKVKMMDAATQCSTSCRDVTTCIDRQIIDNPLNPIKIEWINVDDVKSEIFQDDDDVSEENSLNETNMENFQESNQVSPMQREYGTRSQTDKCPLTLGQGLSAFVPVNTSDGDLRIARLRSIGFKPIRPDGIFDDEKSHLNNYNEDCPSTSTENLFETTSITVREVDELFNKYTSEETTSVGYMDHELRYQDIENEETMFSTKNHNIYGTSKRGRRITRMRNDQISRIESAKDQKISTNEEDSDTPWHGWKKFVKNKQAQWIGW